MWRSKKPATAPPSWKRIALESFKLLCLVLVTVALIYVFLRGGDLTTPHPERFDLVDTHAAARDQVALCGPPNRDAPAVSLELVYSDDMRPWIEAAVTAFSHRCPNIEVKGQAVPDIDAADAIVEGKLKPMMWAATDELSLRYLDSRWKEQHREVPPFQIASSTSLVESPLVLLIWKDRQRLLQALLDKERHAEGESEGFWVRASCALPKDPDITGRAIEAMVPGTWLDWYNSFMTPPTTASAAAQPVGGARQKTGSAAPPTRSGDKQLLSPADVKGWGPVKIRHALPTRDSAGVAALYLMAYDYVLPPKERQALVQDAASEAGSGIQGQPSRVSANLVLAKKFVDAYAGSAPRLRTWLHRCEAGLDAPPTTTANLTKAIFDLGPSQYDGVVTYEHLALPLLAQIDEHADALRDLEIVYPEPTLLARHPAVLFDAPDVSAAQKDAAHRWLSFLQSKEMQEKAIEAGFRPVSSEVTIPGYDVEQNQFLRLRRYGVALQLNLTEAPRAEGGLILELINLWGEVTGRN